MIHMIASQEIVDTIRDGLLVLRADLTVEFANRSFFAMFAVGESETLGRKFHELGDGQWDLPALRRLLEDVVPRQAVVEAFDVEHAFPRSGRRVMRLNARRTALGEDGVHRILLVIEDVTVAHDLEREVDRQRRFAQGIVDTVREPLLVLDGALRVLAASRSFYATFRVDPAGTLGHRLPDLGDGQWNVPALLDVLGRVIPGHEPLEGFLVEHEFADIGRRQMLLNARTVVREGNDAQTLLLAIEDVTALRRFEAEREAALQHSHALLEELNHRVMNSLTMIGAIMAMEARHMDDDACTSAFERVRGRVQAVGDLYRILSTQGAIDAVDANAYLSSVAAEAIRSVGGERRGAVALECRIAALALSTRTAVPLA